MKRILYRYLLQELIPSFFVGLFVFTFVLLMDRIMKIVEWIVQKGMPLLEVVKMFGCLLPSFFVLTMPTALLLSVLLTFSRIHADNELYALKTAGVSLYRLLPPVYFFGTLVTAASLFLTTWAGPQATRTFQSLFYSMASQNLFFSLKERVFFDDLPGYVIYMQHVDPVQQEIEGVFIANTSFPEAPTYYFAEKGNVHGDLERAKIELILRNGTTHQYVSSSDVYRIVDFETFRVQIDFGYLKSTAENRERDMQELTLPELREDIRKRSDKGEDVRRWLLSFHQRLSLPFGALVLCTLGIPLSLLSQRAVRYTGFSLSIVVILMYYILLQVGAGLVHAGRAPAWLGAWIPNLVLGVMGLYLLWKKAEEKPVKILEWYAQAVQDIQEAISRRIRRS